MVIRHVVLFNWIDGTTAADVARVAAALDSLAADLGMTIAHGPDLGFRTTNADYAVVATFTDRAAWNTYQDDPRHKELVARTIVPLQASRSAIQLNGDAA